MNAQEYLWQIRSLDSEIKAKLEQCEQLRSMAARTISNLSSERVSGGKTQNSKLEDCVVKIMMLENDLRYSVYNLAALKREAIGIINSIEDARSRLLLMERYVNGKTWERVAVDMDKSYVHVVHNLHPQAIKHFEKFFSKLNSI